MTPGYQPPLSSQPPKKSKVPWILAGCTVLLLGTILVGAVGGFIYYRWQNQQPANENTGGTKSTQPGASPSPQGSNSNSNQSVPPPPEAPTSWATNASTVNEETKTFTQQCSAAGTPHSVWGNDVYTVDSSICTAAVHAGLITFERGGTVTIEFKPGRSVYGSSERHGVTSGVFGPYRRSFVFSGSANPEGEEYTPIVWNTATTILPDQAGTTYKFTCPAGGAANAVWGTDVYTGDSSICTAAVHAGRISLASGGTVTIELRPGQSGYQGSTRNEVKSNDYGKYSRSFAVR